MIEIVYKLKICTKFHIIVENKKLHIYIVSQEKLNFRSCKLEVQVHVQGNKEYLLTLCTRAPAAANLKRALIIKRKYVGITDDRDRVGKNVCFGA